MLSGIPTFLFSTPSCMQKLFVIIACFCLLLACRDTPRKTKRAKKKELTTLQRMAITYLSYPQFVHEDFPRQLFSIPVNVERYHARKKLLYLSVPKDSVDKQAIYQLADDSTAITFATEDSSGIFLDPYHFTDENRTYFHLLATSLVIDSTKSIHTSLGGTTYEANIAEMGKIFSGEMMFNGPAVAQTHEKNYQGQSYVVGNHCATISPKGEPSLKRLVDKLIDTTDSRETQAQHLLDFVTRQISYTGDAGMEVFRRPTEILLAATADCSGKTVLYASLLEQIDYPYLLVYMPRHIAVAVPGDFSDKNGMSFEHEGERYYFAETTFKGFWIGQTYFSPPLSEEDISYLQYPGKATRLFDVANNDSLEFVKK